jgi:long-chain fatty acid transport protein
LPYGRLAFRLSPQIVAAIDITQPYFTDFRYGNSFIAPFSNSTFIRDTNISPKVSYQINQRLAVGAGLDINNLYNAQLNFAVPPFGQLTNSAESWAVGFDLGIFYVATKSTFLNLAYYSQIVQHASGYSAWGPLVNNNLSADVKLPATIIGNVIQMLSPVWALSGTIRYAQWDAVTFTTIRNTALPGGPTITVPDQFFNNFSYELATHYQFNEKWGGLAALDYEPNVQPTWTRSPGLPTYTRVIPAVGAEYELTKGLKGKLIYAHVFSKAPINMNIAGPLHIQGHDYVNVDSWSLSFTYDV